MGNAGGVAPLTLAASFPRGHAGHGRHGTWAAPMRPQRGDKAKGKTISDDLEAGLTDQIFHHTFIMARDNPEFTLIIASYLIIF